MMSNWHHWVLCCDDRCWVKLSDRTSQSHDSVQCYIGCVNLGTLYTTMQCNTAQDFCQEYRLQSSHSLKSHLTRVDRTWPVACGLLVKSQQQLFTIICIILWELGPNVTWRQMWKTGTEVCWQDFGKMKFGFLHRRKRGDVISISNCWQGITPSPTQFKHNVGLKIDVERRKKIIQRIFPNGQLHAWDKAMFNYAECIHVKAYTT